MNITKLRGLIQESIQEYLKEIDAAGDRAAVEAKMAKIDEAIKNREDKISRAEALTEDEDMKEMVNTGKIASMKKEIKLFEKAKAKYQKQLDKMDGKTTPKKEIDEFTDLSQDGKGLGIGPIVPPEELEKPKKENMNESFVRMQKLAGLITESEYKEKTNEIFGFGGNKAKAGDSVRVEVKGQSIVFKVEDSGAVIEKNDTQYDTVRGKVRIGKYGFKIEQGKDWSGLGPIMKIDKIFLNGKEVKQLTLPS